jgi:hypothetical protein
MIKNIKESRFSESYQNEIGIKNVELESFESATDMALKILTTKSSPIKLKNHNSLTIFCH